MGLVCERDGEYSKRGILDGDGLGDGRSETERATTPRLTTLTKNLKRGSSLVM